MKDLTKRQAEVLQAIRNCITEHGYSPTVRELATILEVRSTSGIFKHLKSLERKGLIAQEEKKARSIELLNEKGQEKNVAVVGSISRGEKIEFFTKTVETAFPEHLLKKELSNYYGFFVKDTSFAEQLLSEGDILAIDSSEAAENHKVVLATNQAGGVIIGTFLQEKTGCKIGNELFLDDEIKILGTLTALVRSY